MPSIQRRAVICRVCDNDVYEKTLDNDLKPVWECTNCLAKTPRHSRVVKTNKAKALDSYREVKAAWEPVDVALTALVAKGIPGGCLLVYASTFDHNLGQLLKIDNPTRFEVKYHAQTAKQNLEKAKLWIAAKEQELATK